MMGSRGWRGAFECDALSHNYRRVRRFRAGQVKAAKRSYWKRVRKDARAACREAVRSAWASMGNAIANVIAHNSAL